MDSFSLCVSPLGKFGKKHCKQRRPVKFVVDQSKDILSIEGHVEDDLNDRIYDPFFICLYQCCYAECPQGRPCLKMGSVSF